MTRDSGQLTHDSGKRLSRVEKTGVVLFHIVN